MLLNIPGVLGLYNGLTASLMRQLTYSTARFGFYETAKKRIPPDSGFTGRIIVAGIAGATGGWIGVPSDLVNVRMQNDVKLPKDKRRNYKHAIDGLIRIYREEGLFTLWKGSTMASTRASLMAIGQLSFYDQVKLTILKSGILPDSPTTHFLSSLTAAGVATTLTMPMDVIKTRFMNAKPGEYSGMTDVIVQTGKQGPMAFFKGFVPAFIRLAPQTILLFIILEQMTIYFGYIPEDKNK